MELDSILSGQSAVLGSDGKIINNTETPFSSLIPEKLEINCCNECNINFSSRKTYVTHMKYKHNESRLVFPCPDCSDTFATAWSVYRHLYNIHHKTSPEVRKMRPMIQSKAYRKDQSPTKISPKKDENVEKVEIDENQEWMDNFETDCDILMCGGCGRRFERRAALNSHSQICQKRIAARNVIECNRLKRIAATDDKVEKKFNKMPKLSPETEIKTYSRRKSVQEKKKAGIQIRYNHIKKISLQSEEKIGNSNVEEDRENGMIKITEPDDSGYSCTINSEFFAKDGSDSKDEQSLTGSNSDESFEESTNSTEKEKDLIDDRLQYQIINKDEDPKDDSQQNLKDCEKEDVINNHKQDSDEEKVQNLQDEEMQNFKSAIIQDLKDDEEQNQNDDKLQIQKNIDVTLDEKMANYVNIDDFLCIPCDTTFKNLSKLRTHMSLHFNWVRYYCHTCSFKAYNYMCVYDHIKMVHEIMEMEKIEPLIFQIPENQTKEMITDFASVDNNVNPLNRENDKCAQKSYNCQNTVKVTSKGRGRPPKKNKIVKANVSTINNTVQYEQARESEPDLQKIYKVIFGDSTEAPENVKFSIMKEEDKANNSLQINVLSRPVRNRVKPFSKDFIYDLQDIKDDPNLEFVSKNSEENVLDENSK